MERFRREARDRHPEKVGTSVWINRPEAIRHQGGGGVEQFAHLMGIVLRHFLTYYRKGRKDAHGKYLRGSVKKFSRNYPEPVKVRKAKEVAEGPEGR